MPRGKRLPKHAIRDVPVLFPNTKIEPTPEQLAYYRRIKAEHGDYAFAIDRQSSEGVMEQKEHTGMIRRVEGVMSFATIAHVWLPKPVMIEDREDGQLPYLFSADDRQFWFLDGETKKATGYAANPNARPEFWRAYLLAQGLTERGCGPSAFIVGEGTRFFRDPEWLGTFCNALWGEKDDRGQRLGARVYIANYGEVTEHTLDGLKAMIRALSSWLPEATRAARAARRTNGQIFHGREPFGVVFERDKRHEKFRKAVYAHAEQWPMIYDLTYALADRKVGSLHEGVAWLEEQYGVQRTYGWLRKLLFDQMILDGYYHCDKTVGKVRKLQQRPWKDLDITETGYRRYLVEKKDDPLIIAIDFDHFRAESSQPGKMHPLPADVVARARTTVSSKGRNRNWKRAHGCLLSGTYMRCAVCGYALREVPPRRMTPNWGLYCQCVDVMRMKPSLRQERGLSKPMTRDQAAQFEECQHVKYASTGSRSLSSLVWNALLVAAQQHPVDPNQLAPADQGHEEARLRAEIDGLRRELAAILRSVREDGLSEVSRAMLKSDEREISAQIETKDRQLQTLCTSVVQRRVQTAAAKQVARILEAYREGASDDKKRELLELLVQRLEVHLAERWWKLTVKSNILASLQRLTGCLDCDLSIDESVTVAGGGYDFTFVMEGHLDEEVRLAA